MSWALRPYGPDDLELLVELKRLALRDDLERLGSWDPARSRRRLLDELHPAGTRLVVVDGQDVGSVALRPGPGGPWLQHFYLRPSHQGRGLGGAVLASVLLGAGDRPVRLLALRGSRALRLYARQGFVHERDHANGLDVVLVRPLTAGSQPGHTAASGPGGTVPP